jgi:hypothetical protein
LLKSNPSLISKKIVDEILKEKEDNMNVFKKSRLKIQLDLYNKISDKIFVIEDRVEIKSPQQYQDLDGKKSKIKKYFKNVNNSLNKIKQKLEKNKFNSDDIPRIYKKLDDLFYKTAWINNYIDFESSLSKLIDKANTIKTSLNSNESDKIKELLDELTAIKDSYYNNTDSELPDIWEEKKRLEIIDKNLSKIESNQLYGKPL